MWHALERLKASGKPLVVSMGDYAASGGYYIACNADTIVAEPGTLTGSIGVFGGKMNVAGLYDKVGVTLHTWQRGQLANLLSATTDFNDVERAKFRSFLEGFYETFLDRVGKGRGMDRDTVHAVAQGRVWTGAQAKERGLVDELGGLDVAVARAAELAKIPSGTGITLERYPARRTLFEKLAEDLQEGNVSMAAPAPELTVPAVREAWATVDGLTRVIGEGGAVVMLPGTLRVD
jgi:protease-4